MLGCAITKTVKPSVGNTIQFNISYSGSYDDTMSVFIVFSDIDAINIQPNNGQQYFFIPGDIINPSTIGNTNLPGGISYYYQNFFSTWDGAIKISRPSTYTRVNGPFPVNTTDLEHSRFNSSQYTQTGIQIGDSITESNIQFSISKLVMYPSTSINRNELFMHLIAAKNDLLSNQSTIIDYTSTRIRIELISNLAPVSDTINSSPMGNPSFKFSGYTISVVE